MRMEIIRTPKNLQPSQYHPQPPKLVYQRIQHDWDKTLWCRCYIIILILGPHNQHIYCLVSEVDLHEARCNHFKREKPLL